MEKSILQDLRIATDSLGYLHPSQRVINRIDSLELAQPYHVLQTADFDCIAA